MKKHLQHIILLILLMPVQSLVSQVNSFSDQYLTNLFLLNPAVAGTGRYGTLVVNSRQQWSGWDGAPSSQSVTFHTKWLKSDSRFTPLGFINKGKNTFSKVGAGGGFFHDSYGVFHLTGFHVDYAYHLFLSQGRLSFGLSPSVFQVGTTSILLPDPNDPYLENPNKSYFVDFNAGVHFFNQKLQAGFSLVQLANSSIKFGNYGFPGNEEPSLNPDLARSVYAYGGYFFVLNEALELKIEPMAMVKFNSVRGFSLDATTTVHLRDQFQAGLSYRLKEGLSVFTAIRLDNVSFRYHFMIPVSAEIPNRFISHMIQLAVNIGQPLD